MSRSGISLWEVGACCGTKDASYYSSEEGWEFGQVSSYVIEIKVVSADGRLTTVTEEDRELMEAMRSSYGMLGIVYEVTYRVKAIRPMVVNHERFHVDEFADRLDELIGQNKSMMLYLFPFSASGPFRKKHTLRPSALRFSSELSCASEH